MSGTRHGVGDERLQISCSIFLIVFFSFTFCVVQCEETPGKKDPTNEVPPLNHNSTDAKNNTKESLTSSPNVDDKKDDKKDEKIDQEKNANANINSNEIVPAVPEKKTNDTDKSSQSNEEKKLPPQVTKKPAENEKKDNDTTNEVENSDVKQSINKSDKSETDKEKSKTDKADASSEVSGANEHSESKESSKSEEKKTDTDHVDKDESGDVTNGQKNSDSDKKGSDSDQEVPAITTNKTDETASKPNAGKSSDSNHSQHSDSTPNLTSPSLSDQPVKTNQEPQEFFRTLKPRINSGNDHNFSFFRLFIVTSVFFVALYVGYYYRHRIKRHFGYNNNEIYYHPLRTMQHNAVD